MVSARAQEYITRFSKGVQNEIALKRIVEYRDDCKVLYNTEDSKKPEDISGKIAKMEYLKDMLDRINSLGEARDYIGNKIRESERNITKPKKIVRTNSYDNPNPVVPKIEKSSKIKEIKKTKEIKTPRNLFEKNELEFGKDRPEYKKGPYDIERPPREYDVGDESVYMNTHLFFKMTEKDLRKELGYGSA